MTIKLTQPGRQIQALDCIVEQIHISGGRIVHHQLDHLVVAGSVP